MKKDHYKPYFFILLALLFIGSVGDTFKSVMVNSSGVIQNTPLVSSNQITITASPSDPQHIVRYSDLTNNASVVSSITNVISVGSGTSLVFGVSGKVAKIPSLIPGANITLTVGNAGSNITIASTGGGSSDAFMVTTTNSNAFIAGKAQTFNGTLFSSNSTIVAATIGSGLVTNIVNAGTGTNLISLSSQVASVRTLVPGSNITLTDSGTNLTISSAASVADAFMVTTTNSNAFVAGKTQTVNGTLFSSNSTLIAATVGSGFVTNISNLGTGTNLVSLSSQVASFRTLVPGSNITLTDTGTNLTVTASGFGNASTNLVGNQNWSLGTSNFFTGYTFASNFSAANHPFVLTNASRLLGTWTNQGSFIVGSNVVFNSDKTQLSDVVQIYGLDGLIDLYPKSGAAHQRITLNFYTNESGTVSGWGIQQDPLTISSHEFSIKDNINGVNRLYFVSNVLIRATADLFVASSNATVSSSLTVSNAISAIGKITSGSGLITNVVVSVGSGTSPITSVASQVGTLKTFVSGTNINVFDTTTSIVINASADFKSPGASFDGSGSVLVVGSKAYIPINFTGNIEAWTVVADQSGSCVIDVWKTNSQVPMVLPTVSTTITDAQKPTIVSGVGSNSTVLTGWTTNITAGDVLGFNIDSATTVTKATIVLKVRRTQ